MTMAPRKEPQVHPPPTPRGNRRIVSQVTQTLVETLNYEENTNATNLNPTFQMDPTMMHNMLALGIATALAAYEAARNGNTRNSGSGTLRTHQKNPRNCSYMEFMGCKP
uniref:Uncharacterized protein n=1 Tax=Lactuca sativa TaxID=4236 RepID=A0A9R1URR9_LACSA|nr:hypothetical protein LSAT_V11C800444350 [Lactuca sativa]